MSLPRLVVLGLGLVWASAVVISIGVYHHAASPAFRRYEAEVLAAIVEANPGRDLGPNFFFLAFDWACVGFMQSCFAAVLTAGVLVVLGTGRVKRGLLRFGGWLVVAGCAFLGFVGIQELSRTFHHGLFVLSGGWLLEVLGILLTGLGTLKASLTALGQASAVPPPQEGGLEVR